MRVIIGAAAVGLFMLLLEGPPLIRAKQYKELIVFGLITAFSLIIYVMTAQHRTLPNPLELITALIEQLGLTIR